MTTRREEINALIYARQFLMDLMDPQKTPRVPKYIREEARARLKHYPLMVAELLATGTHDHEYDDLRYDEFVERHQDW